MSSFSYSVCEFLVKLVLKIFIKLKSIRAKNLFAGQQLSVCQILFQLYLKLLYMNYFSYSPCEFLVDLVLKISAKSNSTHNKNLCWRQ